MQSILLSLVWYRTFISGIPWPEIGDAAVLPEEVHPLGRKELFRLDTDITNRGLLANLDMVG